jgi:hypothetical protein
MTEDYFAILSNADDLEKDIVTSDLLCDGQAWGRSKNKVKTLALNIAVIRLSVANTMRLNRAIASNGLKPLVVTTPLGVLTAKVEVQSRITGDSARLVSLTLTMPDPYWCAQTAKSVQLGSTSNTALVLPAVLPWTLGSLTGGAGTITNDGNADAYPVITVVGTCSNISVTNQTTGENVGVSAALSDNDELVVDCRPATCGVYLNGVADIGLKTSPGWMRCVPGDNQIVFTRNSLQDKKHCTVELNERWI